MSKGRPNGSIQAANFRVNRTKSPLRNKVYTIHQYPIGEYTNGEYYVSMESDRISDTKGQLGCGGTSYSKMSLEDVKTFLSKDGFAKDAWRKFRNGERVFILQRRVNGTNKKRP